jgi:hypothetical protein
VRGVAAPAPDLWSRPQQPPTPIRMERLRPRPPARLRHGEAWRSGAGMAAKGAPGAGPARTERRVRNAAAAALHARRRPARPTDARCHAVAPVPTRRAAPAPAARSCDLRVPAGPSCRAGGAALQLWADAEIALERTNGYEPSASPGAVRCAVVAHGSASAPAGPKRRPDMGGSARADPPLAPYAHKADHRPAVRVRAPLSTRIAAGPALGRRPAAWLRRPLRPSAGSGCGRGRAPPGGRRRSTG